MEQTSQECWNSYYSYNGGSNYMMSDQYYNMGYNGASSWGNGYPVPPGQPPAPPSQPPPPPDDTNPPPPPGEGKPPSPKRLKASIEESVLPKGFPPPPSGAVPNIPLPPLPNTPKDVYGYYDVQTEDTSNNSNLWNGPNTSAWNNTSMNWTETQNWGDSSWSERSDGPAGSVGNAWKTKSGKEQRSFAQVVKGSGSDMGSHGNNNSYGYYKSNNRHYPDSPASYPPPPPPPLSGNGDAAGGGYTTWSNNNYTPPPPPQFYPPFSSNQSDFPGLKNDKTQNKLSNQSNAAENASGNKPPTKNRKSRFDCGPPDTKPTERPHDYYDGHPDYVKSGNQSEQSSQRKVVPPQDWPQSLRNYVSRCFKNCASDVEKDATEVYLKNKLKPTEDTSFIWSTDWDNEPTPFGGVMGDVNKNNASKVGFSFNNNKRGSGFQPKHNALSSKREPQSQEEKMFHMAQQIKENYDSVEHMSFNPGRKRGGNKRQMFKPNADEFDMKPGYSRNPSDANTGGRGTNNRRGRGGKAGRGRGRGFQNQYNNNNNKNNNNNTGIGNVSFDTEERKEGRANRFKKENMITISDTISSMMESANKHGGEDVHFSDVHITGTSTALEKPYLRLTTAPSPDQVRPENVLVKSLSHVMNKWKTVGNYAFVCEQLKSIRQDLTIQNIQNEFAVKVYECHARIAMEKLDLTEYNQCQTRLIDLYIQNPTSGFPHEFLAYRILYYIYIKNNSDALKVVANLTQEQQSSDDVQFAVKVFNSWTTGNYFRFFRYYLIAPKMSGYIMDAYVQRERNATLKKIVKSYKPSVSVAKVATLIGYPDTDTALVYLDELNVVYTNNNRTHIDCKKTTIAVD